MTRKEFLKTLGLLVLALPAISFLFRHRQERAEQKLHPASFYKRLAG